MGLGFWRRLGPCPAGVVRGCQYSRVQAIQQENDRSVATTLPARAANRIQFHEYILGLIIFHLHQTCTTKRLQYYQSDFEARRSVPAQKQKSKMIAHKIEHYDDDIVTSSNNMAFDQQYYQDNMPMMTEDAHKHHQHCHPASRLVSSRSPATSTMPHISWHRALLKKTPSRANIPISNTSITLILTYLALVIMVRYARPSIQLQVPSMRQVDLQA